MTLLKNIRKEQKLTAFELARRTGINPATISRIETGVLVPSKEQRRLILEHLPGVNDRDIFDENYGLARKA